MQPRVLPVRDGLTDAQVVALLRDSPAIRFAGGMELVDLNLSVIEDVSGDLAAGQITRNSYADLHATASFAITRDLDWGAGLVRPYLVVSAGTVSARFNLGVYHTNTPQHSTAESPPTYAVEGYDILLRLADPVGDAYSIPAGAFYLVEIENVLRSLGYTQFIIDQAAAAKTAPTARTWVFADNNTWLTIVNDMLASIGYGGIWSDWDGRLRCQPYILPQMREVEWVYTDDAATTMFDTERIVSRDFYAAPNRWVVYRNNNADDATPVEGNGIYTYVNQSVGETSVDARGGRIITRVEGVDAADQSSLVAQAQQMIQTDTDVPTVINVKTSPNPLHWHFDRLLMRDSGSIPIADVQCTEWSLTLPGGGVPANMEQTWRVVSQ